MQMKLLVRCMQPNRKDITEGYRFIGGLHSKVLRNPKTDRYRIRKYWGHLLDKRS